MIKHILNKHRLEAFVVLFLIVVAVLYFSNGTRAQAPPQGSGGYDAPAPLEPGCEPGDLNYDCFVKPAGGAFSTTSNITSNSPGDTSTDDLVFGGS